MGNKRFITTYTGLHVDPLQPEISDFRIEDIAHALSYICRGNGHTKTFLSVGQHCIWCAREAAARGLSPRLILLALLHDAGECYLSDVPSPLKQDMARYREVENHLMDILDTAFLSAPPDEEEKKTIKEIDKAFLWFDMKNLLEPIEGGEPKVHIRPDYTWRPFIEVEKEYLEIYHQYSLKVDKEPAFT